MSERDIPAPDSRPPAPEPAAPEPAEPEPAEPEPAAPGPAEPEPAREASGTASAGGTAAPEQTLLEQMGGVAGLAYSAVPIVVFVVVNALTGLMPAIWSAIGVAVAIAVYRLVRKEPLQPAISGLLGVAVCSYIAYRSGDAKGFFLLGIYTSLVYGGAFLVSVLVRWPLVGVAWSLLNGLGMDWRNQRRALTGYDLATMAWVVVFAAKYIVQQWLYSEDATGWLAFARIAMGYPLTGLALIVTVWAVRRAGKVAEEVAEQEAAADRAAYARYSGGSIAPETGGSGSPQ